MPHRITISTPNDLQRFVDEYQPTKQAFARIIHQRFGIIAFPDCFDDVPAMLNELQRVMQMRARPIYLGVRLIVE